MKKHLFTFCIAILFNMICKAQNQYIITYSYDAAGNRVQRTAAIASCKTSQTQNSDEPENSEPSVTENNNSIPSNDDSGNKNSKEKNKISNEALNENFSYITITPNPTTGRAVIYFSPENITGLARLEITDVIGKKVFVKDPFAQGVNNYVDISHLQKGVYFLKITSAEEVRVEKVVIE